MIVTSMSNLEIYNALSADLPKLKIRAQALLPKMVKQFKRDRRFPSWKWAEYIHQGSRNRYLITFFAPSAAQADKPIIDSIAFLEDNAQKIVIKWGVWPYRKYGSLDGIGVRAIYYYSSHFFSRYRERVWGNENIPYEELLCRYFSRNKNHIPIEMNEEINRNYEKYGDDASMLFQQPEGICGISHWFEGDELSIGTDKCDVIAVVYYRTIMTSSMFKEHQKKAIGKGANEYLREFHKRLYEDAMMDTYFRWLNAARKGQKPEV